MSIYDQFTESELEVLRERAERAASLIQEERPEARLSALIVRLQGENYALPVELLTAVYQRVPVIPVPCVPSYVAGIANIRGHILAVLDLAVLMGLPGADTTDTQTLVVAAHEQFTSALRVDSIGETASILVESLSPVPSNLAIARADFLKGILPDGTALIDLQTMLGDPAIVVDDSTH